MPLDRYDAVVIGAGVEGLAAALTLAANGKQTLCVDRQDGLDGLATPDDAWISPATARALGLFEHGLRLAAPKPVLSLQDGQWLALWPDAQRASRAQTERDGAALLETVAALRRLRAELAEPGAAAKAMLASLDAVRSTDGRAGHQARFLRASARHWLSRHLDNAQLRGAMLAMAAQRAPAAPDAPASAPMLLALAAFFEDDSHAPRPVAGGAGALAAALAAAFKAAGGELAFGVDVSEIAMDREAAAGVALGASATVKSPLVIAAVSPKRLVQGLLSTRRYGRLLSGLRAPPRRRHAVLKLTFAEPPQLPEARLGLWRAGVSVWLGATDANLSAAAAAMAERRLHASPAVELRFDEGLRQAIAVSPYCPDQLAEGAWTAARRDAQRDAVLSAIGAEWPQAHAAIRDVDLVSPREPASLGGTGAIFGGADRLPDFDAMFALGRETPGPLLKGVHLCVARGLEPDGQSGVLTAGAALGLPQARLRA
jgi:phytoene dehydrogenase-like protein